MVNKQSENKSYLAKTFENDETNFYQSKDSKRGNLSRTLSIELKVLAIQNGPFLIGFNVYRLLILKLIIIHRFTQYSRNEPIERLPQ